MYINFILMLGLAAAAKPFVLTLIGEKWLPSVIYLQLLCFVGVLFPLHALNLNMLQVKGRSDLFLRLEIIKKIIEVPLIILGIFTSIKIMIIGMIFSSILAYYLNSYYSGKLIGYSFKQQVKDIFPSFINGLIIALVIYLIGKVIPGKSFYILSLQIIIGMILTIGFGEIFKLKEYQFIKELVFSKLQFNIFK
jgi:O-antigen/teichoic acid export membrane protein